MAVLIVVKISIVMMVVYTTAALALSPTDQEPVAMEREGKGRMDGWMDALRIYVLFNSISVISGRCSDDNERLCAVEHRLRLRRFHLECGSNSAR